ncbi:hypothetical protein HDU97_003252 [Phlyctochytrium planicorne]|nr:hypothetical protein HDU97_003252 [Phlyctochytrium planicorne]
MIKSIILTLGLASLANAQSLTEVLAAQTGNTNVSTLIGLGAKQADVFAALAAAKNLTLFAPVNSAFETLLKAAPDALNNASLAKEVLLYHGSGLTYIPDAKGKLNTYIPTFRNSTKNFGKPSYLKAVVNATNSNVTIFHGTLGTAAVLKSVPFNNGSAIVHFVDTVFSLPGSIAAVTASPVASGLVAAINKINALATIDGLQGITVLVPTNEAFTKVAAQVSALTTTQLAGVLGLHILQGVYYADNVVAALAANNKTISLPTYLGQNVTLNGDKLDSASPVVYALGKGNTAPGAGFLTTDVFSENGVLHLIDSVLLPDVAAIPSNFSLVQLAPSNGTGTVVQPTNSTGNSSTTASPKPSSAERMAGIYGAIGLVLVTMMGLFVGGM